MRVEAGDGVGHEYLRIGQFTVHKSKLKPDPKPPTPLFLSCGMILEEGLPFETLGQVVGRMQSVARQASVSVVTGDTKVVERGAADKLFINTTGIGVIRQEVRISASRARPGDMVITNGYIGDHGVAVLLARNELALESTLESDTQPLHGLIRHAGCLSGHPLDPPPAMHRAAVS